MVFTNWKVFSFVKYKATLLRLLLCESETNLRNLFACICNSKLDPMTSKVLIVPDTDKTSSGKNESSYYSNSNDWPRQNSLEYV